MTLGNVVHIVGPVHGAEVIAVGDATKGREESIVIQFYCLKWEIKDNMKLVIL